MFEFRYTGAEDFYGCIAIAIAFTAVVLAKWISDPKSKSAGAVRGAWFLLREGLRKWWRGK